MRAVPLLALVAILATAATADPATVSLCQEHHGWAGEESATFTLNAAAWSLSADQKYVLYARSLSAEGSVQLKIAGHMYAVDEAVVADNLPPPPLEVQVLAKNMELTPFSFVSYVANGEDCRLPLSATSLPIALPIINNQPAVAYFYGAPQPPYTFFSITISGSEPVTAVYRYDLKTPLDNAIHIPMNTPVTGQTDNVNTGVYVAAKASGAAVDSARFSITWSLPPPGWRAPTAAPEGGSWRDSAERAAREGGSFLGSFLVTLLFGFGAYMIIRSMYNYHGLGIRTYPDYIPHHEAFATFFANVSDKVDGLRSRANIPSPAQAGVGPMSSAAMSGNTSTRRGYESVGGTQP